MVMFPLIFTCILSCTALAPDRHKKKSGERKEIYNACFNVNK